MGKRNSTLLIAAAAVLLLAGCTTSSTNTPTTSSGSSGSSSSSSNSTTVNSRYKSWTDRIESTAGFNMSDSDWETIRKQNCESASLYIQSTWLPASVKLSAAQKTAVLNRAWAAAILATCPSKIARSTPTTTQLAALREFDPSFNSYSSSSGGSSSGSGYSVTCADGWISSSGGKQGACSSHGGVSK